MSALRASLDSSSLPLFGRPNWPHVRCGDVVENVNETEREPDAADRV